MGFYEELSKVYDVVFPWSKMTEDFIESFSPKEGKILDLACGSGNYTFKLAKKGYDVYAVDLDKAMMEKLKEKAESESLNIKMKTTDMREVKKELNEDFHTIFCIGNSLVHLTDKVEIQNLINDLYNMLYEHGNLIIQIINYDRILKHNVRSLPTIKNKEAEVSFVRNYEVNEENSLVYFNTELNIKEDNEIKTYKNSVPLFPLQSNELTMLLQKAGFKDIELFGSFDKKPFNSDESYALIVKAAK